MDSETGGDPTKEHVSAMDKIADSFLMERLPDGEAVNAELAAQAPRVTQKTYKHPMIVDILLAMGLLFAMAGLTISFVKAYTTHSAKTNIMQGNYKAAIGILRSSPIPDFFDGTSEDLLNQALYLDAMEKLDADRDHQTALQELAKISVGSRFYDQAQDQLRQLTAPTPAADKSPGTTDTNSISAPNSAPAPTPSSAPTPAPAPTVSTPAVGPSASGSASGSASQRTN